MCVPQNNAVSKSLCSWFVHAEITFFISGYRVLLRKYELHVTIKIFYNDIQIHVTIIVNMHEVSKINPAFSHLTYLSLSQLISKLKNIFLHIDRDLQYDMVTYSANLGSFPLN